MSRLRGEINSEEKQGLQVKIVELKETLEERNSAFGILETQIKKLRVTYPKHFLYMLVISHSVLREHVPKT